MTNLASREELITWRTLRSSHAQLCALRYPDKFCRPYEHRKQQRRAVRFAAEQAFEAVFNQRVEFRRLSLKEGRQSTLSQILRIFTCCLADEINERADVVVVRGGYLLLAASLQPVTKGCYYVLFKRVPEQSRSKLGGISRSYPQRVFHRVQTRCLKALGSDYLSVTSSIGGM